ncbi:transposase [Streptomyces sp. NBC_00435]|uniref:transposase n=1 Tax=Streptomyces sp. NBC_00435 TaxID=2903649 RepID=UPI002E232D27
MERYSAANESTTELDRIVARRNLIAHTGWLKILRALQAGADSAARRGRFMGGQRRLHHLPTILKKGAGPVWTQRAARPWDAPGADCPAGSTSWRTTAVALWPGSPRPASAGTARGQPDVHPLIQALKLARTGAGRPRTRPDRARGDKAYSSRANRVYLGERGIKATIAEPDDQRANRRRRGRAGGRPPSFDREQHRQRNTVERCIGKLKQHRAVATRYDKRDCIFNGILATTAIVIWLRGLTEEPSDTV